MSWMRGGRQLGVVAAAAGGSVVGFLLGRDERRVSVDASWTTGYTPSVKWDWNWDRRDADSLVKPLKHKPNYNNNNNNNLTNTSHFSNDINNNMIEAREEKLEKERATASRHLIFVRHGQYNLQASTDQDRTLTKLGACLLSSLFHYLSLYVSTYLSTSLPIS
ncbi:Serine/threonine-protein phosphatase Pgam5, mitochondrial [Portunus trituberculatus]|uniref:Serine/threonine-protein phosphatase Pgam5, mitochondrial n=1 Tax=Portunus trituberculatus TaxID=210409 RepID=A0A5B7J217_PORTR|nr:Serine/threonine-protein phosphatase Pgam5, mitochondrial [Portunus trituberculatus]